MQRRQYLQIPGPTNIPDNILRSLSQPMINHRGPEFERLLDDCLTGVKKVFRTDHDIIFFPSSGSGALESAMVNLFSPGDTIAACTHGVFTERVAAIAEKFGIKVIRIQKEWGEAIKAEDIKAVLDEDQAGLIKGVFVAQNETTSGIANDIQSIGAMMKASGHSALLLVDAISSMASLPYEMDQWGVDVTVSASQKGFMLPPGLSMVALNDRAWQRYEASTMPKWYWDYKAVADKNREGQMPYTPPTTLLFGLRESLKTIEEEGLENIWTRHTTLANATRQALKAMGLELFAEEGFQSDTITTINLPEGIAFKDLSKLLKDKYGVIIGGGLGKLQGKIFRIGHMGSIHMMEIYAILGAVELSLYELGYSVELGTAARTIGKLYAGK